MTGSVIEVGNDKNKGHGNVYATRSKSGFFSGVLVLSLSAVIVKVIGLVYKIPMLRLIGSEGMGYYNSAYEIYALFCVISTAGLPVAMSVLISSSRDGKGVTAQRIFKSAMRLFLVLGTAGMIIMLVFAIPFANLLKNDRTVLCIMAISPTVFFICLSSAYRGYFQGLGKMLPTAVSQVIEALGKLLIGIIFAAIAFGAGLNTETVAAFAVMGLTLGTAISALYLVITKRIVDARSPKTIECAGNGRITSQLLKIAIPVTLSSAVVSLTKIIDMTMILRRMQSIGFDGSESFAAYGNYTTLAVPLFNLAPALITSVALPLVPSLSSAIAANDKASEEHSISDAIRLTSAISMPISVGLALFSKEILEILFSGQNEAITCGAPLLSILALSVPLACYITVGNAILQAYKKTNVPIWSMIAGSAVKIISAYILIGVKEINIAGAPISTFICDLLINVINLGFIVKCFGGSLRIGKLFVRPFAASLISIAGARGILLIFEHWGGESLTAAFSCMLIAVPAYVVLSVIFRVFSADDFRGVLTYINSKTSQRRNKSIDNKT